MIAPRKNSPAAQDEPAHVTPEESSASEEVAPTSRRTRAATGLRASVVVSTRNRADLLDRCLEALANQTVGNGDFEVIVVDNCSSDDTRSRVERWRATHPNIRYAFVPIPSVSRARNAGIASSRGWIVAFLDDDAVPSINWLGALLAGYEQWPLAAAVCGPTRLMWSCSRPDWLDPNLESWLSALDFGADPRLLSADELPWSVNASVVRTTAEELGGFAVELGPAGSRRVYNEDIDFFRRIARFGRIAYIPDALVLHQVDPTRATRRWFLQRAFAQGRSDCLLDRLRDGEPTRLEAVNTSLTEIGTAVTRGWRSLAQTAFGQRSEAAILSNAMARSQRLGYAWEALRGAALHPSPRE